MIILFTDFGTTDPYIGQIKAVLAQQAPNEQVIDLLHHVPDFEITAGAYLLPAYVNEFPEESIFVCVVDPGVGGEREAIVARIDKQWFVGPDNGLLDVLAMRAKDVEWWHINYDDSQVSASFHGRDIFAPIAALIASGDLSALRPCAETRAIASMPDDITRIVFIDHFGNLISGYRYDSLQNGNEIHFKGKRICRARTFSDVSPGEAFFYKNSNGLLEIAVNQGSAAEKFNAVAGDRFSFIGEK